MVKCIYVVVNVMLSNERDEPTPLTVGHIGAHGGTVMYFGSFALVVILVS